MSDKMKEIIERLKKKNVTPVPQPVVQAKAEEEEQDEEFEEAEEVVEQPKKETKKAVKEETTTGKSQAQLDASAKIDAIATRVAQLQNDGLFRLNLLMELGELNETLSVLTATIMKVAGLEEEHTSTDKK